jgi:hypothetical protein
MMGMNALSIMVCTMVYPQVEYHRGTKSLKGPVKMEPSAGMVSPRLALTSKISKPELKNYATNTPFVMFLSLAECVAYPIQLMSVMERLVSALLTTTMKIVMHCVITNEIYTYD